MLFFNILEKHPKNIRSVKLPRNRLMHAFGKNKTHKLSRCFSLDIENGMSPSRLLKDKSLDKNKKLNQVRLHT
jgi:hypothetical protein